MPLGMAVGLGSGDFVFDGYPATPRKKHTPHPIFGPCLLWQMAGWMNMPLGTEVDLGTGHIVLDVVPVRERGTAAPLFLPISIVATVAHLSYC